MHSIAIYNFMIKTLKLQHVKHIGILVKHVGVLIIKLYIAVFCISLVKVYKSSFNARKWIPKK